MKWLIAVVCVLAAVPAAAAPLPIVREGRSEYVIYHREDAPSTVKAAAAELKDYLRRATGADLEIVTAPRSPMISLGNTPAARAAGVILDAVPLEGFRIATRGRDVFILGPDTPDGQATPGGGSSAGTRNGAYAFLERFVGVRWLMPGEHGDYVPESRSLTVPETDLTDAPFLLNRRVPYIQEKRPEVVQWWGRQRLGWSLRLTHYHNWTAIPETAFEEHPEWFAERAGVRVPPTDRYKLCTTNEAMVRAFADAAIRHFDENPGSPMFSLSPSDSAGWCECERCRALYEKDPNGDLSVTPAILTFYNAVARLLAEKHPDKRLGGYVYAAYVFPPRTPIRLEPNVFLVWAPSFDYGYTLFRPEVQRQWDAVVPQWLKVTDRIAYYDLPTSVSNAVGAPNPPGLKILEFLYPRLKRAGMKGVYVYGNEAWGHAAPVNYLLARLAWDPDADVDALFNEFCERAYAGGAEEVKQFYRLLDAETERYFLAHPEAGYTLTDDRLRTVYAANFPEVERLYRAAEAKVADPDPRARLEMLGLNLTLLHWNLRQRGMLADPTASSFFRSDADFAALMKANARSLALNPEGGTARPAAVRPDLRARPAGAIANAEKPIPFLLRGSQHFVLCPTGQAPVLVSFSRLTGRGALPQYVAYDAGGAEVARGMVSTQAPVSLDPGESPLLHLVVSAGSASFSVAVEGAAWTVNGRMDKDGLHFLGAVTPLYFEVPEGVRSFRLRLAASAPGETAVATLYAPDGRAAAEFDCSQVPADQKAVSVRPGDAGFWKLVVRKAPTGVMDDVYVHVGAELPGYFSLAPEQALAVQTAP